MRKYLLSLGLLLLQFTSFTRERILHDQEANRDIPGASIVRYTDHSSLPNYIQFRTSDQLLLQDFYAWTANRFHLNSAYGFQELNRTLDPLGKLHIRLQQTFNQIPVKGSMVILHTSANKIESMSGVFFEHIQYPSQGAMISESAALQAALNTMNAKTYKWQVGEEENALKAETGNPEATYFPKAERFILNTSNGFHSCYAFNIYAQEPLSRRMIYVDIYNGQVVLSKDLIEHITVNGTAVTKYSGTRPFQTDSVSPTSFRLRDAGRGLGVQTYNLNHGSNYGTATDFTDADNYWNNVNANVDEAATDAHWGAQRTYDYFSVVHGRNSIDNAGFALKSYVHYNTGYNNAFWDGARMTYGDGTPSGGFLILTALDVCGHEIGHGLVSYTADLGATSSGTDECDALNEAYADIQGTSVERFARPTQWDWKIGADITCNSAGVPNGVGIRSMQNPLSFGDPICYLGTNWSSAGEPHMNAGPLDHCFYTMVMGSAANSIVGLGYDTADNISYRTLTVHLFPGATYADARFYSIVSSTELYGGCSLATITTTNAWNKVCVGAAYVPGPAVANFTANTVQTCDTALTVNFTNTSTNINTCTWYFGDGTTSTQYNPSHTYGVGNFTVKLVADGGTCGIDSLIQIAYIQVGPPPGPVTTNDSLCTPGIATLTATANNVADTIRWYANAIGGPILANGTTFTTPSLSSTTTYYAEEKVEAPIYHVGPLNNSIGTTSVYTNTTRFMVFNCTSPTILKSVWMNASTAGNRTIILKDAGGTTIQSVTVNLPVGGSVVTLNMPLPVGNGLQLGFASTSTVNVYRNTTGAVYPYTNGPVSITGNTAAGSQTYYYFFYDWVLQAPACISTRTPAIAVIGSGSGSTPATITPAGPIVTCSSSPVVLSANLGSGYTYQWYFNGGIISGATSATYSAAASGNYSVVVNSNNGCQTPGTSNTVNVTLGSSFTATVTPGGNQTICAGNALILSANTGSGYTYQWYNGATPIGGATASTYSATAAGTYKVVVTTSGNCSATSGTTTIAVNNPPVATLTPSGTAAICQGSSLSLAASTGAGYTYQWLLNNATIGGATSPSYSANSAGTYAVIVNTAGNCPDTSSTLVLTINPNPTAVITANGPVTFCVGGQVTLNATLGTGYAYQWYKGSTILTGATASSYVATQAGTYSVVITTTGGCTASSNSITVTVNALPVATVTPSGTISFCQGDSLNLFSNTGVGYTYQWLNGATVINGATAPSYQATAAGSYSVIQTNSNGCKDTSSATVVNVNSLPVATITPQGTTSFCAGGTVVLQATTGAGYTYQWYNGALSITGATGASYTTSTSGSYTVKITNSVGCFATSAPVTVVVNSLPNAVVSCSNTALCAGDTAFIVANTGTGYTYTWYKYTSLIAGATQSIFKATQVGSYSVVISDVNGCSATSNSISIIVTSVPTPTIINTLGVLSLSGGPYNTYQWYKSGVAIGGATNPTYTPTTNGDYSVEVTLNGCKGTAAIHMDAVGVQDHHLSTITVSPNPFTNTIVVDGIVPEQIRLVDMTGQIILIAKQQSTINVNHVAKGIYFLQIFANGNQLVWNKKMVKVD